MKNLLSILFIICISFSAYSQTKISDLPAASSLLPSDVFPIVQSGVTKKASGTNIISMLGNSAQGDTNSMKVASSTYADFAKQATNAPDGTAIASQGGVNLFTKSNTISGVLNATNPTNNLAGTFNGSGTIENAQNAIVATNAPDGFKIASWKDTTNISIEMIVETATTNMPIAGVPQEQIDTNRIILRLASSNQVNIEFDYNTLDNTYTNTATQYHIEMLVNHRMFLYDEAFSILFNQTNSGGATVWSPKYNWKTNLYGGTPPTGDWGRISDFSVGGNAAGWKLVGLGYVTTLGDNEFNGNQTFNGNNYFPFNNLFDGIITALNSGNSFAGTFNGTFGGYFTGTFDGNFPQNVVLTNELDFDYFSVNTTNQIVSTELPGFPAFGTNNFINVNSAFSWNKTFQWSARGITNTGAYTNNTAVFFGFSAYDDVWIVSRTPNNWTNQFYYNEFPETLIGGTWFDPATNNEITGSVAFNSFVLKVKFSDMASNAPDGNTASSLVGATNAAATKAKEATNTLAAPALIGLVPFVSLPTLSNALFNATIYANSNRVVSALESNAMFTTNIVFILDSTSSNLLFTFPSPPANANVSFSIFNGGTNTVTFTNTTGNTFKIPIGYFSAYSNAVTMSGYFGKGQTWINLNSTNWTMIQHSRTLQDLQDVARSATLVTNGNLIASTNLPASSINGGDLGIAVTNHAPVATSNLNIGYGLVNSGGSLVLDTNYVNTTSARELLATEATTTTLPAYAYNNANGTITGLSVGGLTIDGQTVAVGDTILVKNETTAATNGIYTCSQVGSLVVYILTRASYFNSASNILVGDTVFVRTGTVNTNTVWELLNTGAITIGTTPLNFLQTGFNTPLGNGAFGDTNTMHVLLATNDSAGRNISTLAPTNSPLLFTPTIYQGAPTTLTQSGTNLVVDGSTAGYATSMNFNVTCTNNLFLAFTNWSPPSRIRMTIFQGTGLTNAISYRTNRSTTAPFVQAPYYNSLPTNTANDYLVLDFIATTSTNMALPGQFQSTQQN